LQKQQAMAERKSFIEKYLFFLFFLKFLGALPFREIVKNGKCPQLNISKVSKVLGSIFIFLVLVGNLLYVRYAESLILVALN